MAIKKISEFDLVNYLEDSDLILIERNGVPKSIKVFDLKKYFGSGGSSDTDGTFEFTVSGTNGVLVTDDPNNFIGVKYENVEGIYDWFISRTADDLKIVIGENEYFGDATELGGGNIVISKDNGLITILCSNNDKFGLAMTICSDNVTDTSSLPDGVEAVKDRVFVYYGGNYSEIQETDFPLTIKGVNLLVPEEQDASITFVNNKLTINMPTDSGTTMDEDTQHMRLISFSYSGIFNALNSGTTYALKLDGTEYTYYEGDNPPSDVENSFSVIKGASSFTIFARRTSTQSVMLLVGADLSDAISVSYVNEEVEEQLMAPTWLPSSFPHIVEFTIDPVAPSENEFVVTVTSDNNIPMQGNSGMCISNNAGLVDWLSGKMNSNLSLIYDENTYSYTDSVDPVEYGFTFDINDSYIQMIVIGAKPVTLYDLQVTMFTKEHSESFGTMEKDDVAVSYNLYSHTQLSDFPVTFKFVYNESVEPDTPDDELTFTYNVDSDNLVSTTATGLWDWIQQNGTFISQENGTELISGIDVVITDSTGVNYIADTYMYAESQNACLFGEQESFGVYVFGGNETFTKDYSYIIELASGDMPINAPYTVTFKKSSNVFTDTSATFELTNTLGDDVIVPGALHYYSNIVGLTDWIGDKLTYSNLSGTYEAGDGTSGVIVLTSGDDEQTCTGSFADSLDSESVTIQGSVMLVKTDITGEVSLSKDDFLLIADSTVDTSKLPVKITLNVS